MVKLRKMQCVKSAKDEMCGPVSATFRDRKLLYMFRVVTPPIIRSTYNCNYSIWHWSNFGKCSVWKSAKDESYGPVSATFRYRKLLYMFRVVTSPIIRSTYNCNYSIWHWSNFGKCSVWSQLKMRGMDLSLLLSAIAEGSRDRSIPHMCSWWWVELPPETCRAVYRNIINCT